MARLRALRLVEERASSEVRGRGGHIGQREQSGQEFADGARLVQREAVGHDQDGDPAVGVAGKVGGGLGKGGWHGADSMAQDEDVGLKRRSRWIAEESEDV